MLADETTFSMAESGSMVLDEMVYDPATQEGSLSMSVVEGVFTFVSGQVAKTDPDAMTLDTPVATIGIRGTQVGIDLTGDEMTVVLMEEADGFVGEVVVTNEGGVQILNTAFQGTSVASATDAPSESFTVDKSQLLNTFGGALNNLPKIGNANTYGTDEKSVEELVEEALTEEALTEEELTEEELAEEELEEELTDEELAELETEAGEEELEEGLAEEELEEELAEEELEEELSAEELAELETAAGEEESEEELAEEVAPEEESVEELSEELTEEDLAGVEELAEFDTASGGEEFEEELAVVAAPEEESVEELAEVVTEEDFAGVEELAEFETAAGGEEELTFPIRLTPMTATCRVPPLSRVKLGIGWSRGVARDAEQ